MLTFIWVKSHQVLLPLGRGKEIAHLLSVTPDWHPVLWQVECYGSVAVEVELILGLEHHAVILGQQGETCRVIFVEGVTHFRGLDHRVPPCCNLCHCSLSFRPRVRIPYLVEERGGCEIMKLLFDLLGLNHRIKFII